MDILTLNQLDCTDKRVLLRVDLNVPLASDGSVADDTRIRAIVPTVKQLLQQRAKIVLLSHLGRPKGRLDKRYTLEPIASVLSQHLDQFVDFVADCIGPTVDAKISQMQPADILLLENLRFYPGEEANDLAFAEELAQYGDVYINDAFGALHRAHASTFHLPELMLHKGMGLLVEKELHFLDQAIRSPRQPFVVLLGGSKISDKIGMIEQFIQRANTILVGGAMAYTFLAAQGLEVGASLMEPAFLDGARHLLQQAQDKGISLLLPIDHRCVDQTRFESAVLQPISITQTIGADQVGGDIGPATQALYAQHILQAATVLWNGPMGMFEQPAFAEGTYAMAQAMAQTQALTIVGGGDSARAMQASGLGNQIDFISTGGGATLAYLSGEALPGLEALK